MNRQIPTEESLTVEFKSDIKKLDNQEIFEAVVAFSNTEGGELYIGVEDDGTITGAHKDHLNPITLSAYIANNTMPPVSTRSEVVEEEKPVLKISVPKSYHAVVATVSGKIQRRRIKADGTPENVPMFPSEIATRLSDLRLLDYSALPVLEATPDDFDLYEAAHLRKVILSYDGDRSLLELSDTELFKALGFVREQEEKLYPTITGLLMIGKIESIKRFVPTMSASFQVLEGTMVRVNEDFVLPVLASVEKLIGFMEAWNQDREIEMGIFRMSAPDFDKRALREAIVNAFSHRDYSKMGRVRVSLSDEGLIVANPGGFVEGISANNLLTAEPHGRNPLLADALKRVGLAEKTGRGIDRIFEGSLIYGRTLPDYSSSTSVTVSLFIPKSAPDVQIAKMVANEQKRLGRPLPINTLLVLNELKNAPRSSLEQIAMQTNLTKSVVKVILERMLELGLIEEYGEARNQCFVLTDAFYKRDTAQDYSPRASIDKTHFFEQIKALALERNFITKADVVNLLHISDNQALYLIKKMVANNELRIVQKGRYAKYVAVDLKRKD